MTVTTADCKKFLVGEIAKNPRIVDEIFRDEQVSHLTMNEKKWRCEAKFKPTGNHDYAKNEYDRWCQFYGPNNGSINATDLECVRIFTFDPEEFDSAISFMVLEDLSGNLILGENMGD